jgi:hypothetical protein
VMQCRPPDPVAGQDPERAADGYVERRHTGLLPQIWGEDPMRPGRAPPITSMQPFWSSSEDLEERGGRGAASFFAFFTTLARSVR